MNEREESELTARLILGASWAGVCVLHLTDGSGGAGLLAAAPGAVGGWLFYRRGWRAAVLMPAVALLLLAVADAALHLF